MAKRAALYIRVSTDEQAKNGYSVGEQRADLERYATAKGYTIAGIYADEGTTARKAIRNRRELQRLLRDVQAGSIDIILIKCLDRWSRSVRDYYKVQDILDAHGVVWECTQEEYNTTTTNGRLMLNLKLAIAQNESDTTGDRIRYIQEGMKRRKMPLSGTMPIGYKTKDRRIVIDEAQAPIIRFIFENVASGKSMYSMIDAVKLHFDFTVSRRQIYTIVRNREYLGEFYGVPDFTDPIISQEMFDAVQRIISTNRRTSSAGRVFLFAGLIRCPVCGNRLASSRGVKGKDGQYKWFNYRCSKRYINHACSYGSAVSEGRLERWLVANIQSALKERWYRIQRGKSNMDSTKKELAKLKEKLRRLKVLFLDDVIDMEEYKNDYKDLKDKIREMERAIIKNHALPPTAQYVLDLENFPEIYAQLSREHKAELWHALIESIEFDLKPLKRGIPLEFRVKFLL